MSGTSPASCRRVASWAPRRRPVGDRDGDDQRLPPRRAGDAVRVRPRRPPRRPRLRPRRGGGRAPALLVDRELRPARGPARRRRRPAGHGSCRRRRPRPSEPGDDARRDHRHEREDDDVTPAGVDHARGGDADHGHRHAVGHAHDPGGARPPGAARRRPVDGHRGRRHGGLVARHGDAPRRRHVVRRRGVHQPRHRPPRPARDGGGRTSAPRPACSRQRWLRSA